MPENNLKIDELRQAVCDHLNNFGFDPDTLELAYFASTKKIVDAADIEYSGIQWYPKD